MKVVIADETLESGVPMQWVDSVTNGITYFRACLDLSGLSEDLRVYLPLFASVHILFLFLLLIYYCLLFFFSLC